MPTQHAALAARAWRVATTAASTQPPIRPLRDVLIARDVTQREKPCLQPL